MSVSYLGGHNLFPSLLSFLTSLSLYLTLVKYGYSNLSVNAVTSAITHLRGLSLAIYLQVWKMNLTFTGLEGIGFIISITIALSDTKLSFKHPNDTLKFNEILSPANI